MRSLRACARCTALTRWGHRTSVVLTNEGFPFLGVSCRLLARDLTGEACTFARGADTRAESTIQHSELLGRRTRGARLGEPFGASTTFVLAGMGAGSCHRDFSFFWLLLLLFIITLTYGNLPHAVIIVAALATVAVARPLTTLEGWTLVHFLSGSASGGGERNRTSDSLRVRQELYR